MVIECLVDVLATIQKRILSVVTTMSNNLEQFFEFLKKEYNIDIEKHSTGSKHGHGRGKGHKNVRTIRMPGGERRKEEYPMSMPRGWENRYYHAMKRVMGGHDDSMKPGNTTMRRYQ
mgnify:CR=1 FL=1